MLGQFVIVFPTKANIEEITFSEHPGIALQVAAEPELGGVATGFAHLGLLRRHLEFHLFGRHHDFVAARAVSHQLRHRAEMAPGTYDQGCLPGIVDHPVAIATNNGLDRCVQLLRHGCPVQKKRIELAAPYAVTDNVTVVIFYRRLPHHAYTEPPDGLEGSPGAVVVDVDVETVHHRRGNPAGAGLVPREILLIDHQNAFATVLQCVGKRGACGPGTHDNQVVVVHDYASGAAGDE